GCCLTVVELSGDGAGGTPRETPAGSPAGAPAVAPGSTQTRGSTDRTGATEMSFDLSAETLDRTWLAQLQPLRRVNLERAARLDTRLGGHLVSGHVDALGTVVDVVERGDGGVETHFEVPVGFERYLIEKGSITIDGVSLTVVAPRGRRFHVALIPETLRRTTLGECRAGTRVHLEADQIGKWIERLLEARR
ncbi:MAG: riboflavin synthase, partial [Planctomycetes bacterium]|nr:riboflavin synthase [Planctomycetota bacterium]